MLRYVKRNDRPTRFDAPPDMPEALHRLLEARGIESAGAAEQFLHPDVRSLLDPFGLSCMAEAVEGIRTAIRAGDAICVYGDYDVDGVCASAILCTCLKRLGGDARVYLPSRHAEGYGLNERAVREIAGWAKLMVTVDCGVTSVELVGLAKSLGLRVVVTDHHRPADKLPDCPVVNPLLNGYGCPHLCGAGVAWKLAWALEGRMPLDLVDIAALATVADVVSLTGENRAIVAMGLEAINRAPRPGIAALIESSGMAGKPITATAVAFQLAPRLNAGGRLDTAMRPFALVTAETAAQALPLAEALERENNERRALETRMLSEAEEQLRGFDFIRHRAIILCGKDWNPGVIGLTASRLVEKYHYPVVMLSDQGEKLTGSCRSIEGVDIHAALTGCAEHILRFGGHRQAAGLTLEPGKLCDFIDAMDAWLSEHIPPETYIPVREYDDELELEAVTPALVAALEGLQPTGMGNPAPVFRAQAEVVEARAVGAEGAHLKLTLSQNEHRVGGIAFREGGLAPRLSPPARPDAPLCRVDALFVPKLNTYMGRTSAQLEVRALAEADANARIASKLDDETALQCDFLTEILYNKKIDAFALPPVETVEMATLTALMAARPQGTLAITSDLAAAARLVRRLEACPPDVYFGELPEDPRAFNAVCVCPPAGKPPAGYGRIALCGAPAEWLGQAAGEDVRAFRLQEHPAWMRCLPDLDGLREAYRALAGLLKRPARFYDLKQLAHLVSAASGLDMVGAMAALLAILDMGLFAVDVSDRPARLERLSLRKADPEQSAVWQAIQRWKSGAL